jgi:hypothetical protein
MGWRAERFAEVQLSFWRRVMKFDLQPDDFPACEARSGLHPLNNAAQLHTTETGTDGTRSYPMNTESNPTITL